MCVWVCVSIKVPLYWWANGRHFHMCWNWPTETAFPYQQDRQLRVGKAMILQKHDLLSWGQYITESNNNVACASMVERVMLITRPTMDPSPSSWIHTLWGCFHSSPDILTSHLGWLQLPRTPVCFPKSSLHKQHLNATLFRTWGAILFINRPFNIVITRNV